MTDAFLAGAAAGYGIAIPVGAIAILIVETGLRRGFGSASAAGAGAAAADGTYAAVAAVFGTAVAGTLAPAAVPIRVAAVIVLAGIAGRGLLAAGRSAKQAPTEGGSLVRATGPAPGPSGALRVFFTFLGLTLLNPVTVTYFTALILGFAATGVGPAEKAAFVAGAFLASLSWQEFLAAAGALLHRRLPARLVLGVGLVGNLIVLGFAAVIAADLLA